MEKFYKMKPTDIIGQIFKEITIFNPKFKATHNDATKAQTLIGPAQKSRPNSVMEIVCKRLEHTRDERHVSTKEKHISLVDFGQRGVKLMRPRLVKTLCLGIERNSHLLKILLARFRGRLRVSL